MRRKLMLLLAALMAVAMPLVGNISKAWAAVPSLDCNLGTFSSSAHFTSGACAVSGDVWVFQVVAYNTTAAPTISDGNSADPSIPSDGTQYSAPSGQAGRIYTQRVFLHLVTASEATSGFTFSPSVSTGGTISYIDGQELGGVCWSSCSNYPVDMQTVHASAGPTATTVTANVGGFTTNYANERAFVVSTSWSDVNCSCGTSLALSTGWASSAADNNSTLNTVFESKGFGSVSSAIGNQQSYYSTPVNAAGVLVTQMFTIRGS